MESMVDRDVSGCDVGDHFRNEERIVFRTLVSVKGVISGFLLEGVQATDTGGEDHADTILVDTLLGIELSVVDSLLSSHEGILGVEVELAQLLAVEVFFGVKILYLTCKLRLEKRSVEMSDGAGSALTLDGTLPSLGHVIAEGSERTESGDYNSF